MPKSPMRWLAIPAAGILCILVYANAVPNGFIYDDWDLIERNAWVKEGRLLDAFRADYWEQTRGGSFYYRPLISISYWIEHRLWGDRPAGYHLTNLLLHSAVTLLVLWLGKRWLSPGAGLAAALLFAVHPVHTQSTSWIAGRTDLLATLFCMATLFLQDRFLLGYLASREPPGTLAPGRGMPGGEGAPVALLLLSCGTLAMALLSKEVAVVYPLILILHAWVLRREKEAEAERGTRHAAAPARKIPGEATEAARRPGSKGWVDWMRPLRAPLALSVLTIAVYLAIRELLVGRVVGYAEDPLAWWRSADGAEARWLAVPSLLSFYLVRMVFPWRLGFESGLHPVTNLADPRVWLSLAACLVFAGLVMGVRRREVAACAGFLWFLATLLPVLNLFPVFESAMEHFLYLPSVGFILAATALARRWIPVRRLAATLCGVVVILLGVRTVIRNRDWRDEVTFWRVTVSETPVARAYNNLGLALWGAGIRDEAEEMFRKVLALRPDLPSSHSNLGIVAASTGRRAEAIAHYRKALDLDPGNADALFNLALVLETNQAGERYGPGYAVREAAATYERLVELHPRHWEGWVNLGVLRARQGQMNGAIQAFECAVELAPWDPEPHGYLASILWDRGERERSVRLYRRYLELSPEGELAGEARSRITH